MKTTLLFAITAILLPFAPLFSNAQENLADSTLAPTITVEPLSQSECSGSIASFTVVATGTALTYQWRNGSVDLLNGGNVSGATTATLTLNPITAADFGLEYNVVISGTFPPAATSTNVGLLVKTAPFILLNPANQTAIEGHSASFNVTANGNSLMYQWRKGLIILENTGNTSGVTTETLTINPVTISDAGTDYNVVITGSCDPGITSANAFLAVTTTGIAATVNWNNARPVSISPNPFKSNIEIVVNDTVLARNIEINVYNVLGVRVMQKNLTRNTTTLGTDFLPSGLYMYAIIANNKTIQSGKLISE